MQQGETDFSKGERIMDEQNKPNARKKRVVEGGKGIVEYGDKSIKINAGKYILAFCGRGLHIQCMNDSDIVIHGFVTSIEYIM